MAHLHYRILTPQVIEMFPFSLERTREDLRARIYIFNYVQINNNLNTQLCVPLPTAELPVKDHSRHKH